MNDPFINSLPKLDLHGETADIARALIINFIEENYLLGKNKVVIIHGKGKGILKQVTKETLMESKLVTRFHVYGLNDGLTICYIKPLALKL